MTSRLDEIDRQIIHALMADARNTTATTIAEGLNVSGGTVRNRIDRLEEDGVIRGYTARIDFERAGGRLTSVYMCTVPAAERERLALAAESIPGVVNVRVLMAGRRDLQVVAVGENTEDLREIARSLSELDIEIEDEELLQTEIDSPYAPFAADDSAHRPEPTDVVTLPDGHDVVEVAVTENAPVAGESFDAARTDGILAEDVVVVSVERDGEVHHPTDVSVVEADDVVTLLPREESRGRALAAFLGEDHGE
ncbi:MAG: AsnC family transcriptional regulator [Halobacteriales archaeon SW_9_67_25]|jgi:DNA-binding Lrp family transcriptional regulator|nr:MAG: AsnC family transcriptional regulator [Halobacteriales archaeon SW_9_67_25]